MFVRGLLGSTIKNREAARGAAFFILPSGGRRGFNSRFFSRQSLPHCGSLSHVLFPSLGKKSDRFVPMNDEPILKSVFFYGLFMDEDLLKQKGLDPKDFRLVCVEGYGLRIGERATLEPSEGEQVFGSVMTLAEEELKPLYAEASVADYVPVRLTAADLEGNQMEVISYILPMNQVSGRNPDYARALLSVAEKLGLPDSHLREIEKWI